MPARDAVTSTIALAVELLAEAEEKAFELFIRVASTVPVVAQSIVAAAPVRISKVPPFNKVFTASSEALRPAIDSCII